MLCFQPPALIVRLLLRTDRFTLHPRESPAVARGIGRRAPAPAKDDALEPVMLKILREDFRQAVVLRVRPEMCVEPAQLVRRAYANSVSENRFIGVQDRELF